MAGIKRYRLEHPEWLQVKKDGNFSYGYDQEWYEDAWKRLAGCGPTTATQVISYVLFRDGHLPLETVADGDQALVRMNQVWEYVRPRYGVDSIKVLGGNKVSINIWQITTCLIM